MFAVLIGSALHSECPARVLPSVVKGPCARFRNMSLRKMLDVISNDAAAQLQQSSASCKNNSCLATTSVHSRSLLQSTGTRRISFRTC